MTTETEGQTDAAPEGPSDAELITAVRAGDNDAYATLYTRHHHAALRLARTLTRNHAESDDLVADAFTRILTNLQAGKGPDLAFRAYLHTTVRHTFYDRAKAAARTQPVDEVPEPASPESPSDPAVDSLERSLAAKAFQTLPERWQQVLWHTEIEGDSPAQVAPLLGLTPNGVAALAYRARERLRQAYLQAHLADTPPAGDCAAVAPMLAGEVRGNLSARDHAKVGGHLDACADCAALHAELADLNTNLGGLLAPAILGTTWAAYLGAGTATKTGILAWLGNGPGEWAAKVGDQSRRAAQKVGRNGAIAAAATAAVAAAAIAGVLISNDSGAPQPESPPAAQPPVAPPGGGGPGDPPGGGEPGGPPGGGEPGGPANPPAAPAAENPPAAPEPPASPTAPPTPTLPPTAPPTSPSPTFPPTTPPNLPTPPGLPGLPTPPALPEPLQPDRLVG